MYTAKDPQLKVIKFKEENWRRYAHRDANKGAALLKVMEKLGISPEGRLPLAMTTMI